MSRKPHKFYLSPFTDRYSSPDMRYIWSEEYKYERWRYLWYLLASSQKELGVDISDEQVKDMLDNISSIDMDRVAEIEKDTRHDVMAHISAYGEDAPSAKSVIHLGATSQYVVDNADVMAMRDSILIVINKVVNVIDKISKHSISYSSMPTVGLTHFQKAQPVTFGKRIMTWVQELVIALEDLGFKLDNMKTRGIAGATGSKLSYLELFEGDENKVDELDRMVCSRMGFDNDKSFLITGQTYPRIMDSSIISSLCLIASACSKICNDIRLLSGRGEVSEGFDEENQKGSSAMPYKRNPIKSEKVCSLSRHMISISQTVYHTSSNQWLERSLDDSSSRRLVIPEAFLIIDEILETMIKIFEDFCVDSDVVDRNYNNSICDFISEKLIIEFSTVNGHDRQETHKFVQDLLVFLRDFEGDKIDKFKKMLKKTNKSSEKRRKEIVGDLNTDEIVDRYVDNPSLLTGTCEQDTIRYKEEVVDKIIEHYRGGKNELV